MSRGHVCGRSGSAAAVLLVVALLVTGFVTTTEARAAEGTTPREKMLSLTNQDRSQHDKRALKLHAKLSRYAERHSAAMAERGTLFHTSVKALSRKLDRLAIRWTSAGENVGVSSTIGTLDKTLAGLEKAFMRSDPHRTNILNARYDHAATGVFQADDGQVWVTVIFYG